MLSFLTSCVYKDVVIINLENVNVKKLSADGVVAEVFLRVKNPNKYSISIVDADLNIAVNGKELGKAAISEKIKLPKNSEMTHRITIESNFEKLGSGVIAALATVFLTNTIKLGVNGTITARALFVRKKIKVDFNQNVSIPLK